MATPQRADAPDDLITRDYVRDQYRRATTTTGDHSHAALGIEFTICGKEIAIKSDDEWFDPDDPSACGTCKGACLAAGRRRFRRERNKGWR